MLYVINISINPLKGDQFRHNMRTAIQAIALAAIVLKVAAAPFHVLITSPKHEPRSINFNTHEWREEHLNETPTSVHVPDRHYKREIASTEAARRDAYCCLAAIRDCGGRMDYVFCLNDIRGCGSPSAIDLEFHRLFNDHNVTWPQQIEAMFSKAGEFVYLTDMQASAIAEADEAPVNPNINETVDWDSDREKKHLNRISEFWTQSLVGQRFMTCFTVKTTCRNMWRTPRSMPPFNPRPLKVIKLLNH